MIPRSKIPWYWVKREWPLYQRESCLPYSELEQKWSHTYRTDWYSLHEDPHGKEENPEYSRSLARYRLESLNDWLNEAWFSTVSMEHISNNNCFPSLTSLCASQTPNSWQFWWCARREKKRREKEERKTRQITSFFLDPHFSFRSRFFNFSFTYWFVYGIAEWFSVVVTGRFVLPNRLAQ